MTRTAADFEMVVGLEVHVQLDTRTKIFCRCSTDFGAPPNSNTCPVCLGLPGVLPVLNAHAVSLAVRAALALGARINPDSVFARKNYFYPDLPKGYQISQYDRPLASGGFLTIGATPEGGAIRVGLTRLHLEEDAGKSIHDRYPGFTAIDLNRAGVPLVEIVTEPVLRSPAEARAFLATLKQFLEYAGVSDVNMEKGSLRVDANVSARPKGETRLGVKTEVKNLNSFSGVERALEAEYARHCHLLAGGDEIVQQTMLWDQRTSTIRPARSKEESHDYRYFPDPDLPPLILSTDFLDRVRNAMPELPAARVARFAEAYPALTPYEIGVLTASAPLSDYFEHVARAHGEEKAAAKWVMGEVLAALNDAGGSIDAFVVRPADLAELLDMARDGVVTLTAAKKVFTLMLASGDRPSLIADREALRKITDDGQIDQWIDEVVQSHPGEAARFFGGERRLHGVLVGLVLKRSGGSADPARVNALLARRMTAG